MCVRSYPLRPVRSTYNLVFPFAFMFRPFNTDSALNTSCTVFFRTTRPSPRGSIKPPPTRRTLVQRLPPRDPSKHAKVASLLVNHLAPARQTGRRTMVVVAARTAIAASAKPMALAVAAGVGRVATTAAAVRVRLSTKPRLGAWVWCYQVPDTSNPSFSHLRPRRCERQIRLMRRQERLR